MELLQEIAQAAQPAEQVIERYCRARRYMGAKDRRAIQEQIFAVIRAQARLTWWLQKAGPAEVLLESARARLSPLFYLRQSGAARLDQIEALCGAGAYGPYALEQRERDLLCLLPGDGLDHPDMPEATRCEVPDWLWARFQSAFGEQVETELLALREPAPVHIRSNTLLCDRAALQAALAEEGIETQPCGLAPHGLVVSGRRGLLGTEAFRKGWFELQDEAAQLAALLCDVKPNQAVLDLCAGGGGKTLPLAAALGPDLAKERGRLVAFDIDAKRLAGTRPRLKRAGITGVELSSDPEALASQAASFDRVLVDAPCSGTGRWRRSPDARWRLTAEDVSRDVALQQSLLNQAASLTTPGGRLIYATCSLLPEENVHQVEGFLEAHEDFTLLPISQVWAQVLGGVPPGEGNTLNLTPAGQGTDGFFVAALERKKPKTLPSTPL
ncbi:MAG: RsmB/NOP family class I SAM-dependent RNA methyltransferase [Pseudomonadota bacterium]